MCSAVLIAVISNRGTVWFGGVQCRDKGGIASVLSRRGALTKVKGVYG